MNCLNLSDSCKSCNAYNARSGVCKFKERVEKALNREDTENKMTLLKMLRGSYDEIRTNSL